MQIKLDKTLALFVINRHSGVPFEGVYLEVLDTIFVLNAPFYLESPKGNVVVGDKNGVVRREFYWNRVHHDGFFFDGDRSVLHPPHHGNVIAMAGIQTMDSDD